MKKVIVVCRAGPRSSKWPWPIPSSCQRNSFRPFDWRPAFCATLAAAMVGVVRVLATLIAVAGWIFPGGIRLSGKAGPWPGRVLPKKLILVAFISARLHSDCRRHYSCTTAGLRSGTIILSIIRAGDFHSAMNLRPLSNSDPQSCDIAADFPGRPDFHAIAPPQGALHFPANDNLTRIDVRGNLA